jgi:hypothetical protein
VGGIVGEVDDCTWCGSAGSIDHGICQVCLMPYPEEHIEMPDPDDPRAPVEPATTVAHDQDQPSAEAEAETA